MTMDKQKYRYTLEKKNSHTFVFNKEIPLEDYDQVYLYINDGKGNIVTENIGNHSNCCYLMNIIEQISYVYVPVNQNNQLIRNQIVFDPAHVRDYLNIEGNFKIGSLIIQMYKEDGTCLLDIDVPMNEKKVITLKEDMPMNQNIYISIRADITSKKKGERIYYLFDSRGVNNKVESSFKIDRTGREYIIYPR